jgi:hypothetical protein
MEVSPRCAGGPVQDPAFFKSRRDLWFHQPLPSAVRGIKDDDRARTYEDIDAGE